VGHVSLLVSSDARTRALTGGARMPVESATCTRLRDEFVQGCRQRSAFTSSQTAGSRFLPSYMDGRANQGAESRLLRSLVGRMRAFPSSHTVGITETRVIDASERPTTEAASSRRKMDAPQTSRRCATQSPSTTRALHGAVFYPECLMTYRPAGKFRIRLPGRHPRW